MICRPTAHINIIRVSKARSMRRVGGGEICRKDTTTEDLRVEGNLILHGY